METLGEFGSIDTVGVALPIFMVWLVAQRLRWMMAGMVIGLGLVLSITIALKIHFADPSRPFWPEGAFISQYFPSGHTALATAVYGSVAALLMCAGNGTWRIFSPMVALVVAVIVAISRVTEQYHPAGDALAGFFIGMLAPVITYAFATREHRPLPTPDRLLFAFLVAMIVGWTKPVSFHGLSNSPYVTYMDEHARNADVARLRSVVW